MVQSRRTLLLGGTAFLGLAGLGLAAGRSGAAGHAVAGSFEIEKTEAEWRVLLDDFEYAVLRQAATEHPHSSPLNEEHRPGTYACRGCALPLFDAATKFESGTGWPSFYQPLENAVGTATDYAIGVPRTEVHCRRCGGHLGHVFEDGPPPTGLRYCMNGVALQFLPASA